MNCMQKSGKKMKIGILTYHRARNYGSALQAYALTHYLRAQDMDAEIIDYHTKAQDRMYSLFEPCKSFMSFIRNAQTILYYLQLKKKKKRFDEFLNHYIQLGKDKFDEKSDLSVLNAKYDKFICGSDQIWNYQCTDFTTAYLLDFVEDKSKCISYAPSIGIENIEPPYRDIYARLLSGFGALSAREKIGADCISDITGRVVETVPDPVLLLTKDEWLKIIPGRIMNGKYIFCYYIGDVPRMRDFAISMHKKTKLPLVVVNMNLRDQLYINKKEYSAGPLEFLSLLKNCEYVCTNSFHAVMFSILFHKNFWVFTNSNKGSSKSRIEHITSYYGLTQRVINTTVPLPHDTEEQINFFDIDKKIEEYGSIGRIFLKNSLGYS